MSQQKHQRPLFEAIDRLAGARVGVVGDLVADLYVSGLSDRVSREAPVLIVRYEDEWLRPGGAANVAANIAALGATAIVVGMVGNDEIGHRLLDHLRQAGGTGQVLCDRVVLADGRETISKTRFLAGAKLTHRQQVLRVDRQPAQPPDARLIGALRERVAAVDSQVQAWIASDYGYGSFDHALRDLLRDIAARKPVVADSRWELHRFSGMTLLKPNEEEAETLAHHLGVCANNEEALACELASKLEAKAVLITLGNQGMVLSEPGRMARIPAVGTEEIVDLTGAGDSVAAALTTAVAADCGFDLAARLANYAGSIVVMKEGAATVSPDELREAITRHAD